MKKIYTYLFVIIIEKGESGYIAYAPGVGGVYEEGRTKKEAERNAYESACAILETRIENNDPLSKSNKYLTVLTEPPTLESIASMVKDKPNSYIATPSCASTTCPVPA